MMTPRTLLKEIVRVEIRKLVRETVRGATLHVVERPVPAHYGPVSEPVTTYRGDSHAKKSARLRVWELIQKTIGRTAFRQGPHLFLASREGGDASVLRGLGVLDRALLAVDIDAHALQEFHKHYPNVPCRNQDVAYVMSEYNRKLESAFLDFSSQVNENTLNKVRFALRAIKPNGVLACTFAIGREKWWNGAREDDTPGTSEDRLDIVESFLADELDYGPRVLSRMHYMSESVRGPGALMGVIVVQLKPGRAARGSKLRRLDYHDLQRDVLKHSNNPNLSWLLNCTEDKAEALRKRVREYPPPRVT